jgi:hypothetical protein
VDASKPATGEVVAAVSGLVLLIVLFLPWYGADLKVAGATVASGDATAWEAFGFIDVLLFLVALVAIGVPAARAMDAMPEDVPGSLLLLGAGVVGLLLVLYRLIDVPGADIETVGGDRVDIGRKIGLFLGLIATAGIAYGGWRASAESGSGAAPTAAPPPRAPPPSPGTPA